MSSSSQQTSTQKAGKRPEQSSQGKLKFSEYLGFGLSTLTGGVNTIIAAFITMFYTDNVGMAAGAIGTMLLVSKLMDGISDLAAGSLIDKTRTKWGKARPWLLWASVPMGISVALIFFIPPNGSAVMKHYLEADDRNASLYFKGDADKRAGLQIQKTNELISDMDRLAKIVSVIETLQDAPACKVFFRVLEEQSYIDKSGARRPKDKKDIAPDSVQNPYDTTETYRNKRGPHHGYTLNIEETIDGNGNGILTNADYQPNNVSDSVMVKKHLDSLPDDGQKRTEIADGGYFGDEAGRLAEEKNVNLFTTSLTGKVPDEYLADFEISDDAKSVLKCPKGYKPYSSVWDEKQEQFKLAFLKSQCTGCPYAPYCKGHDLKRKPLTIVSISLKTIARARTVRFLGSDLAKAMAR